MTTFSVLMSLYAKEKPQYLRECFESLVAQTHQADEVVLVFDGPVTPELEVVVAEFEAKLPLKVVKLVKNNGLGKALNEGLKHCAYDWVFRMDTDDVCLPQRFAKQIAFIERYPETVVFGGQIAEFDRDVNHIVSYRHVPTAAQEIIKFTQRRCPFNHMTVAYQKSAVVSCGGYEDLQEDYSLWIKLIAQGKNVANLPDILVYARVGNGMVGRRRGLNQAKAEWRLFKLKYRLGIQGLFSGLYTFVLRSTARFLPGVLLKTIYHKFLRKSS